MPIVEKSHYLCWTLNGESEFLLSPSFQSNNQEWNLPIISTTQLAILSSTLFCSGVTLGHIGPSKTLGPPPWKALPEQILRCQSQQSALQSCALVHLNHLAQTTLKGKRHFLQEKTARWCSCHLYVLSVRWSAHSVEKGSRAPYLYVVPFCTPYVLRQALL